MSEAKILTHKDWTVQWQAAEANPIRLLLMVHGLSGDEHSMWIFTRNMPSNYAFLAPRGLFPAKEGGYTWRTLDPARQGLLPNASELKPAADALVRLVDEWSAENHFDAAQFDLTGFSQGTALSYLLTILYPHRVARLAALSGFIPEGAVEMITEDALVGKPIFVSHSREDEMVPVEQARAAVQVLSEVGAKISYCETEGRHKVSKDCLHGLAAFFRQAG